MAYIAFASAKASPGVTTTIAALAATWPRDRELHIAELDPAGGDLAVRYDLAVEPGLVTLAAAGRRELSPDTVLAHSQQLPVAAGEPSRRILVGPVAADQAAASLGTLRLGLPRVLAALGSDVLVDCGRLDPGSPVQDVATEADLLVVVTRPVIAEVHHLAGRLASLRPRAVSLLLIGERPYSVAEVAEAVGASPLGTLPADERAAAALTSAYADSSRLPRRARLLRDARAVAEGLAEWLAPSAPVGRPAAPAPTPPAPTDPRSDGAAAPSPPPPAPPAPAGPPGAPPVGHRLPPPQQARPASAPSAAPPPTARPRSRPVAPAQPPPAAPPPGSPWIAPERAPGDDGGPRHFRRDSVEEPRR